MDSVFGDRLAAGERLLWTGRSAGGLLLSGRDAFLIPFSLLWGGFAIVWETMVLLGISRARASPSSTANFHATGAIALIFPLFGSVFVIVGLFLIFGRFMVDAWLRKGMFYALTDRRVLILKTRPTLNFTSLPLDRLPALGLSERGGGRGSFDLGCQRRWQPSVGPDSECGCRRSIRRRNSSTSRACETSLRRSSVLQTGSLPDLRFVCSVRRPCLLWVVS